MTNIYEQFKFIYVCIRVDSDKFDRRSLRDTRQSWVKVDRMFMWQK